MKRIIVTGSNRGIGLEFVRQYLGDGNLVFATCRNPDQSKELNQLSEMNRDQLMVFPLEVVDSRQLNELHSRISSHTDGIDLLINNAGVFPANQIDTATSDQMIEAFQINTIAPFLITRKFRDLLRHGQAPLVVNVSSLLGSVSTGAGLGHWADYAYGPSKAALNRAVRQLAIDLKTDGITVIAQNPGWVKTDMGGSNAPLTAAEAVRTLRNLFPKLTLKDSGRVLEPNGTDAPW
jgi:NAD(P)-dependent dehydrogenase (short-subunit alcohol dehydrogenase family)